MQSLHYFAIELANNEVMSTNLLPKIISALKKFAERDFFAFVPVENSVECVHNFCHPSASVRFVKCLSFFCHC